MLAQRRAAFADIASEILVSQTPLRREGRLAQTQLAYQEPLSPRGAYECFSVAHTLSGFCKHQAAERVRGENCTW